MWKVLNTLLTIRTSSAVNLFFYYLQRVPLVGKLVKSSVYASMDLKRSAAILVYVATLLWSLLSKLLYLFLLVYLPVTSVNDMSQHREPLELFVHIFAFISLLTAGISSAKVLEPKKEKYIAVKLMRMSPKHYMHAFLSYRYVLYLVSYIPTLLLFVLLLHGTVLQALALAVAVTAWRVLSEYVHLKLFEKKGIVVVKQVAVVWIVIFAGYIAAYLPLFLDKAPPVGSILTNGFVTLGIAALGAWAAVQLARYRHFREAVDAATKRDDPYLNIRGMIADANKMSVEAKESDYSDGSSRGLPEGKEGYAYLNAIFFARHRRVVSRPVHKRIAIIAGAGVVGSIAMLVLSRMQPELLHLEMKRFFSYLPLALSLFTVGETTCRAMFYHCDISLTRYSFYRSAAYEHFLIRLRKMIGQNLRIAAVLAAALMLVTFTSGGSLLGLDTVLLWLSIAGLAIFFTTHHLFLYYIFQPYSTDLNVKNPLYFTLSMVVSGACGAAVFFQASPVVLTIVVLVVTILYTAIATVLVRKYAHKTFRVK